VTQPLVSVCLPNLNMLRFLPERVETIFRQTYKNWELIVSDNYSEDGAWTFFEQLARADRRVSIAQAPRNGLYGNWNRCIERARGDFVYIATSDDTMAADCLEKMVAALEANPACAVAHCPLRAIDDRGKDVNEMNAWWSEASIFAKSSGPLLNRLHVRRAPFDGLLHLLGGSVYTSITQLLVRRSVFGRIGVFEPRWGSMGDFNWNMRVSLLADTVHVPSTWGGWRIHPQQATAGIALGSVEHARQIDEMIEHAATACGPLLPPWIRRRLHVEWLPQARALRSFERAVARRVRSAPRKAFIISRALTGSAPAWQRVKSRLTGSSSAGVVQSWLDEVGFGPALFPTARTPRHADAPINAELNL
jgi:hypothetical protein